MNFPVIEPPCIPLCPTVQPSRAVEHLGTPWAEVALALSSYLPTACRVPSSQIMDAKLPKKQCCPGLSTAAGYKLPGLEGQNYGGQECRDCSQRLQSPRKLARLTRLKRPRNLRSTKPFCKRLCSVDGLWGTLSCGTAWKLASELHGGSFHESSLMLG